MVGLDTVLLFNLTTVEIVKDYVTKKTNFEGVYVRMTAGQIRLKGRFLILRKLPQQKRLVIPFKHYGTMNT